MTLHVFDFLDAPAKYPAQSVCVVFGAEDFLRRLARRQILDSLLGDDSEGSLTAFDGERTEWRDVIDELSTFSMFGGGSRRVVVVEAAKEFVTKHRSQLERYAEDPQPTGVLVLDVTVWPANTRLYKLLDSSGLQVDCRSPEKATGRRKVVDEARICHWLSDWSQRTHDARLAPQAARTLLDLVGEQFGVMDQELAKLALFAGRGGTISPDLVRDVVGGWRTKTTWELIDAALEGQAAEALKQLDRLLQTGEHPLAMLGPISWSLRRFAAATRAYERAERQRRPIALREALLQAGFRTWPAGALERAEGQLKQLGRQRAGALYRWLLDADLALKGSHSSPERARLVLEQLVLKMAKQAAPPRPAAARARGG